MQGDHQPVDSHGVRQPVDSQGDIQLMDSRGDRQPVGSQGDRQPVDSQGDRQAVDSQGDRQPVDSQGDRQPVDSQGHGQPVNSQGERQLVNLQGDRQLYDSEDDRQLIVRQILDSQSNRQSTDIPFDLQHHSQQTDLRDNSDSGREIFRLGDTNFMARTFVNGSHRDSQQPSYTTQQIAHNSRHVHSLSDSEWPAISHSSFDDLWDNILSQPIIHFYRQI